MIYIFRQNKIETLLHILSKKKTVRDSSTNLTLLLHTCAEFWTWRSAIRAWRRTTYTNQLSELPKPRRNSAARRRPFHNHVSVYHWLHSPQISSASNQPPTFYLPRGNNDFPHPIPSHHVSIFTIPAYKAHNPTTLPASSSLLGCLC